MALADDIKAKSDSTFEDGWDTTDGKVVPAPDSLTLGNTAVYFKRATILYADLDGSTSMVETLRWYEAAEIYKSFLYGTSRLIRYKGGSIVA